MDASPLAKIPGELRNQIYLAYFEQTDNIYVDISGDRPFVQPHILAVMQTCRQAFHESLEVFRKARPAARFTIATEALLCPTARPKAEQLANVALVLYGSQSKICAYGVREVEVRFGKMDLTLESVQARINAKAGERGTLLHDGWDCETLNNMAMLTSALNNVPCRLVCSFDLGAPHEAPLFIKLSKNIGTTFELCYCQFAPVRRWDTEWQALLKNGGLSAAEYQQRQAAMPLISKVCANVTAELYPPWLIDVVMLQPDDLRWYQAAVRQRGSYMATEVEKRRQGIAARMTRDRDLHCFSLA